MFSRSTILLPLRSAPVRFCWLLESIAVTVSSVQCRDREMEIERDDWDWEWRRSEIKAAEEREGSKAASNMREKGGERVVTV